MKLSIIICTRNRAHAITGCLDSVAEALSHAAPIDAEIVVVDNASEDNTSDVVRKWAETCAFPLRLVAEPQKGLARARNTGVKASKGELLIFTDDDCRLSKDYFVDVLRHDAADTDFVLRCGRVELGDPSDLKVSYKNGDVIEYCSQQTHPNAIGMLDPAFIGANMMMRRTLFDKLGDFDIRFGAGAPFPGGEETDYVYRAYSTGMIVEYVPDMLIYHFHGRKTIEAGKKLLKGYAVGLGALYAKNLLDDKRWWRPLCWQIRNAILDPFGGETISPGFQFSNLSRVSCLLRGWFGFYILTIKYLFVPVNAP